MPDTKNDDRTPNWNKWRLIPDAMLWQCVLLSLNIDPDTVEETSYFISATRPIHPIFKDKEFKNRIDVAVANVYRTLQPTQHSPRLEVAKVSLRQFAVWVRARETRWAAPAELLAMADQRPQDVNWNHWGALDLWPLDAACKLISGGNPNEPTRPGDIENADINRPEWVNVYHQAVSAIKAGNLSAVNGEVIPVKFIAWAQGRGRDMPHDAPLELLAMADEHDPGEGRPQGGTGGPKWPWGSHETKLLHHLAAAADRFWKNYDPSEPTTAPKNQEVINWLKKQGVAERNAQVMATILRADNLPTGPRT